MKIKPFLLILIVFTTPALTQAAPVTYDIDFTINNENGIDSATLLGSISLFDDTLGFHNTSEISGFDLTMTDNRTGDYAIAYQTVLDGTLLIDSDRKLLLLSGTFGFLSEANDLWAISTTNLGSPYNIGSGGLIETYDLQADGAVLSLAPVMTVPIPAAIWLFGPGLIGLVGFGRRMKV